MSVHKVAVSLEVLYIDPDGGADSYEAAKLAEESVKEALDEAFPKRGDGGSTVTIHRLHAYNAEPMGSD